MGDGDGRGNVCGLWVSSRASAEAAALQDRSAGARACRLYESVGGLCDTHDLQRADWEGTWSAIAGSASIARGVNHTAALFRRGSCEPTFPELYKEDLSYRESIIAGKKGFIPDKKA